MAKDTSEKDNVIGSPNQYVVVTAITQFRSRFVVPMDELQKCNTSFPVDPKWALDLVTCDEVKEFSQLALGDVIISHEVIDENAILQMFDRDNEYLSGWTTEQKLEHIRQWEA